MRLFGSNWLLLHLVPWIRLHTRCPVFYISIIILYYILLHNKVQVSFIELITITFATIVWTTITNNLWWRLFDPYWSYCVILIYSSKKNSVQWIDCGSGHVRGYWRLYMAKWVHQDIIHHYSTGYKCSCSSISNANLYALLWNQL